MGSSDLDAPTFGSRGAPGNQLSCSLPSGAHRSIVGMACWLGLFTRSGWRSAEPGGRVLSALVSPLLLGRWPSGPRLPGAEPPGSAGSTCAHHLPGLPEPPVFFRPKDRGLRQITLGRILTERCEPHSSQDEQGKSQMALHLNEPTTMDSTVAHADGQSFLGPVVITAHLRD